ncbi:hypothetical protein KFK09_009865 [Dendrobium nobile]|uniref:Uncharacterized protein n=1 Tax=Dendrobium nobile TaxID=94219 RepID=A0A8T3BIL7_DENNO|nr:hypothetical protein KFK09_009865 [Dendrobium nobile]
MDFYNSTIDGSYKEFYMPTGGRRAKRVTTLIDRPTCIKRTTTATDSTTALWIIASEPDTGTDIDMDSVQGLQLEDLSAEFCSF